MTGNDRHGLVVQDRDRHLLRELGVMRVIDREQAKCVAGFGSTTQVNIRLLRLTRAGLLRRIFLGTKAGGRKALYTLSASGAKLVGVPLRGPRRRLDEVLVADFFVAHQLAINAIYCDLKFRPIPIADARFERWMTFYEPIGPGGRLIPDGYVEISTPTQALAMFLEVDLGNEGLSIWKTKVTNYLRFAVSRTFEKRFSQPRFRVLVATNTERRMKSLRAATASLTDKIFWFSTLDLIAHAGFWSPVWLRANGGQGQPLL